MYDHSMHAKHRAVALLLAFVAALVALSGAGIDASPALAKPTHLISVGARSFRCQCDPTAVDLNFSGECRRPSNGTTMLSVACSALANNCVCTEISHLVRRAALCDAESSQPLISPRADKIDERTDPLFDQLRTDLASFKAGEDFATRNRESIKTIGAKLSAAFAKGCQAIKCSIFGAETTKPNFVEVVPRSANGDYEVDLKLTPNSPINDFANGQSDAEIRTIFTRPSEFQLKEQLGQGGFGVVYRAKTGGEEVAIKMLRMDQPEFVLSDLKINNEMLRVFGDTPYEQLFSLPRGVLKLKRPGRDDQLALVMDKMDMDAFTYIENGMQRNTEFVRTVGATMFHGLRVMDRSGIVHRDIKPENILVTGATHSPDGTMVKPTEARIADFGLAIRSSAISVGKIAGTTGYFSPEAFFGRVQSHKSDMWAAGVSLFEIAVGKHPFGTFQDDAAGMIDAFARLLGKDGVPAEYHSALSVRPEQAIPLKDFLAKSIVNSRMVDMPLKKRLELADLLEKILVADPEQRISADVAVQHPFFRVRA